MGYRIYAKVLNETKEEVASFEFGKYVEMFNELRNDRVLEMKEIEHAFNYHQDECFEDDYPGVRANNVIDLCEFYREDHDLFSISVTEFIDAMYEFIMSEEPVVKGFQYFEDVNMFDLSNQKEECQKLVGRFSDKRAGLDLSRIKMLMYTNSIEGTWLFEINKIFRELQKIEELEKCTVLIYGF